MSDKQETTDDIIREMRDLGALDAQCNDMIPRSLQALGLRTYAGRLEAAVKRGIGNASALREALGKIVLLTARAGMSISCDVACGIIAATAKHALAAPPRNCDRFATAEDALAAYDCARGEVFGCANMIRTGEPGRAEFDWLFAPAEGGVE